MEYEIRVVSSSGEPPGKRRRLPLPKLPKFGLWLWGLIAAAAVVLLLGAPSLHTGDECVRNRRGDCLQRQSCNYVGIQGWKRFVPTQADRQCPFVKMLPVFYSPPPPTDAATVALHRQDIRPLYWGIIGGFCPARTLPGCERVAELVRSKEYTSIRCTYGPLHPDGSGYYIYDFWYGKVPDNPAGYVVPGQDHPFTLLGTKSLDQCPAKQEEASVRYKESHPF